MAGLVARRGAQAIGTLLLASLIVHASISLLPGDPIRALFGFVPPPPEVLRQLRAQYHLDEPYVVQYLLYLRDLATLDLGQSIRGGGSVNDIVASSWVPTAWLFVLSLVVQVVLGTIAAVTAATRPGTWASRGVLAVASVMVATPIVLTAPWLHHLLTDAWGVLPRNPVVGGWRAWILPVIVLAAVSMGTTIIFLRSQLRQTLRQPFVHYAIACGIPPGRVTAVHALRVAFPPVLSHVGANLGLVVVGLVVAEGMTDVGGLGATLLGAIQTQDRSVVVGITMLLTMAVIALSFLVDVLVGALDPRVRVDAQVPAG